MKILITDVYCYQNKGDAGIVVSMVQQLEKHFDNPKITISTLYPELDKNKYGANVDVISAPILPRQNGSRLRRFLHNVYGLYKLKKNIKSEEPKTDFIRSINEADIVLSCGGGFMQCRSVKEFLSDFIFHYAQLNVARKLHKNYVVFAQTIGPFNPFIIKKLKKIMNDAKAVIAREQISYDYVKMHYPTAELYQTADIAFLLQKKCAPTLIEKNNKLKVGITVRDWNFPNSKDRKKSQRKYLQSFINFLNLRENNKYDFYLMPQVIGPGIDNDLIPSREILDKVKGNNVHLITFDLSPEEIKFMYSQMDYFIGTRMHSNIFSLSEGVPCLAISYDYKTDGIMKMADQSYYVIKIDELNETNLNDKFHAMLKDSLYVSRLNKKIPSIKKKALSNINILKSIV